MNVIAARYTVRAATRTTQAPRKAAAIALARAWATELGRPAEVFDRMARAGCECAWRIAVFDRCVLPISRKCAR